MKPWAERFYKSKAWKMCRKSFIAEREKIDGGMCQTCGERRGYIVHHRTWLTPENINNPDIALNHDNLKYDCLICHNKEPSNEDELRCTFDKNGQPIPKEEAEAGFD